MAAAVMGDDAIAMMQEEQHLRVPVIGRQRPAMTEHDRLAGTPVLVEDLDAVFGGDGGHCDFLLRKSVLPFLLYVSRLYAGDYAERRRRPLIR